MFGAVPVDKPQSAVAFYNLFSASGHTGFEQVQHSILFFQRDTTTGILSLVAEHGIDQNTSGQTQPAGHVIMDLTGLPTSVAIVVRDDQGEINPVSATSAHGDWHFQANTDGAAFAGFPFPGTWTVTVAPQFLQGIITWTWVRKDGSVIAFDLGTNVTLTAFDTPSACRTDCTVPVCGDGILDGGEVCDDGNNVGGDGCAADCKSLN